MIVAYHHRRPRAHYFSIEGVFRAICAALPPEFEPRTSVCRFHGGLLGRLYNMVEALFRQGAINHIVGDVHYLALLLPRLRTVLTIHDCVGARTTMGLRRLALILFWYRLPVTRCIAVTAISQFAKEEALRYVPCDPEHIRVIHDPVATQFVPDPRPFNAASPTILQVGTGENKNLVRLAEALNGLRCHLDIIGKVRGKDRQALQRWGISYSENFGLTTEQVAARYRCCDMVVLASTYEGFGLPIVEANATGRPIVTSNICSMPEVAGSAACFVNPFDSTSIRQGIIRVTTDPGYRADLIAQGFENVKRFRVENIAAQYAALYREILSRAGRRAAFT